MTDPNPLAELTARLLGRPAESVPEPEDTTTGNHVPGEGNNPKNEGRDPRTFVSALFDRALSD